jgi:hypothetical protein
MLKRWFNRWFVTRYSFELLKAQLDEVLYQSDRLARDRINLQNEVAALGREGLALFRERLRERQRMFQGNQEQLSVMRTGYPKLGDLYVKKYIKELE